MQQIIKKYVRHNRSSHLPGSIMCQAVPMHPSDCEYSHLRFLDSKLRWLNLPTQVVEWGFGHRLTVPEPTTIPYNSSIKPNGYIKD